jgi:hypothetical protein
MASNSAGSVSRTDLLGAVAAASISDPARLGKLQSPRGVQVFTANTNYCVFPVMRPQ